MGLPQRAVSSNIQIRVDAGRVQTLSEKGRRGSQKIGRSTLTEALIAIIEPAPAATHAIKVAMPIGRYTRCEVSVPCGLTSPEGIIKLLDMPDTVLALTPDWRTREGSQ